MTEAVIVSTARTPIGKAYRGALNATEGATLLGHAIEHAVKRANVDPKEIEDVVMGAAMQQGATGGNIARKALLRAGLPVTVGGTTIDRQCASGLQAMALAARSVIFDGVEIAVGGGGESISLVQNDHANKFHAVDPALVKIKGDVYMPMIDTAEVVAKRYNISREKQDEYSLESQRRTAAAQQGGKFKDEIAPISTSMAVVNKDTKEVSYKDVTLSQDEGPRPDTTAEGLAGLKPVRGDGHTITAGNASQLSDGASATVIMSDKEAAKRGLKPLGIFRGFVAAGCEPDEMGIGPVFAIPRLLERQGPNTRHPGSIRFTATEQVTQRAAALRAYLLEAMGYADAGIVPPKEAQPLELPDELVDAMDADPELAEAFHRLTPGRQRSYAIHLGSAKTAATRVARIEKARPNILAGKGANER